MWVILVYVCASTWGDDTGHSSLSQHTPRSDAPIRCTCKWKKQKNHTSISQELLGCLLISHRINLGLGAAGAAPRPRNPRRNQKASQYARVLEWLRYIVCCEQLFTAEKVLHLFGASLRVRRANAHFKPHQTPSGFVGVLTSVPEALVIISPATPVSVCPRLPPRPVMADALYHPANTETD